MVVRLPGCSKARVEDGERGEGLVVLDEVWLGTTGVIVLGVENISHPSHRQVKTLERTVLPATKNGIDDIGYIYMRLPDIELSQELSRLPILAVTCNHRTRQSHYRSDKIRAEGGGSTDKSGSLCFKAAFVKAAKIPLRSEIQSSEMCAIAFYYRGESSAEHIQFCDFRGSA